MNLSVFLERVDVILKTRPIDQSAAAGSAASESVKIRASEEMGKWAKRPEGSRVECRRTDISLSADMHLTGAPDSHVNFHRASAGLIIFPSRKTPHSRPLSSGAGGVEGRDVKGVERSLELDGTHRGMPRTL